MTSSIIAGSRKTMSFGSEEAVRLRLDITSYPTNGESITPTILGLESSAVPVIVAAYGVEPAQADNNLVHFVHDRANNKLKAIVCSTGVELANGEDLGEVELIFLADKQ